MTSSKLTTRLARLANVARTVKGRPLLSLVHHIDVEMLRGAFERTRKDGAVGIDGETGAAYAVNLEERLADLHERLRSNRYQGTAVRRTYIPKGDGRERPLGIPTFEDKVVQRAALMVMEQVYEQEFYDCSYGFRPNRSALQAIAAIRENCRTHNVRHIIDADIAGFFDAVDHTQLQEFIARRINDKGIRRLIGKWLNAGVWEQGQTSYPGTGTPQGGVISPLLANIYLHYVLDDWFEREIRRQLRGKSFLVRYADDFIIGCELQEDAQTLLRLLWARFAEYGLKLHEKKTRLVAFGRPSRKESTTRTGTFVFLGFHHHWMKSPRTGGWYIRRKIAGQRFARSLKNVRQWLKANRHQRLRVQCDCLKRHLLGIYRYFGVLDGQKPLWTYRREVERAWRYWLNRRGAQRPLSWTVFRMRILANFSLPSPLVVRDAICRA